jgi:hypothetical protein
MTFDPTIRVIRAEDQDGLAWRRSRPRRETRLLRARKS